MPTFHFAVALLLLGVPAVAHAVQPPQSAETSEHQTSLAECEKLLRDSNLPTDAEGLLQFFRKRTLAEVDRGKIETALKELGSPDFDVREKASEILSNAGLAAIPLLRQASRSDDYEVARRADRCLNTIAQDADPLRMGAAARVLAATRHPQTVPTLWAYCPMSSEDEPLVDGIVTALTEFTRAQGKADPLLLAGLQDPHPARRTLAVRVLGPFPAYREAIRQKFIDADVKVRFVAASTLLRAEDPTAVPVLLTLLTEGPSEYAFLAEDLLCQLLGDQPPPMTLSAADETTRRKCRTAWEQWWKDHSAGIDLGRINRAEALKGLTLIIEVDNNGGFNGSAGRIWECGPDGKQRWEITAVGGPVDVQVLPGGKLLIAEYYNNRVTERDRSGKVLWESPRLPNNPVSCQRLPNGNTLIGTMSEIIELTRDGKRVGNYPKPTSTLYQVVRARNGHTFYLSNNQVVELDVAGKEMRRVSVGHTSGWAGLELLPNGHFLISYYVAGNKIAEIDGTGKVVWEMHAPTASRTQKLRNGNILVAGGNHMYVAEYDRNKKEVWRVATVGRPFSVRRY